MEQPGFFTGTACPGNPTAGEVGRMPRPMQKEPGLPMGKPGFFTGK